jgi:hypothetical protein
VKRGLWTQHISACSAHCVSGASSVSYSARTSGAVLQSWLVWSFSISLGGGYQNESIAPSLDTLRINARQCGNAAGVFCINKLRVYGQHKYKCECDATETGNETKTNTRLETETNLQKRKWVSSEARDKRRVLLRGARAARGRDRGSAEASEGRQHRWRRVVSRASERSALRLWCCLLGADAARVVGRRDSEVADLGVLALGEEERGRVQEVAEVRLLLDGRDSDGGDGLGLARGAGSPQVGSA